MARQTEARIYMRMEDLDTARARAESVQQAYDDLGWLGLTWDSYASANGGAEFSVVQSHRLGLYAAALEQLMRKDAVYPCTCTRAQIAAAVAQSASAPHEEDSTPRYPGTCAKRAAFDGEGRMSKDLVVSPHCYRLRVPPGPIAFDDVLAGPQSFDVSAEVGDFPLTRFSADRPGPSTIVPAYQLACVADDHAMAIDMVIRGDDLLSSTPRQLVLYRALGWEPPRFGHIPLVVGADGKRLAKRHGESRIAQFRAAGVSPERIIGWAAWRSGLMERPEEISAADLLPRFAIEKIPRERIVLESENLAFLR
jgi:glutamyl-tRNA synthetase